MNSRSSDAAERLDDENPEWTAEDFSMARPALEVVAEVFGPEAVAEIRLGQGRLQTAALNAAIAEGLADVDARRVVEADLGSIIELGKQRLANRSRSG